MVFAELDPLETYSFIRLFFYQWALSKISLVATDISKGFNCKYLTHHQQAQVISHLLDQWLLSGCIIVVCALSAPLSVNSGISPEFNSVPSPLPLLSVHQWPFFYHFQEFHSYAGNTTLHLPNHQLETSTPHTKPALISQ